MKVIHAILILADDAIVTFENKTLECVVDGNRFEIEAYVSDLPTIVTKIKASGQEFLRKFDSDINARIAKKAADQAYIDKIPSSV